MNGRALSRLLALCLVITFCVAPAAKAGFTLLDYPQFTHSYGWSVTWYGWDGWDDQEYGLMEDFTFDTQVFTRISGDPFGNGGSPVTYVNGLYDWAASGSWHVVSGSANEVVTSGDDIVGRTPWVHFNLWFDNPVPGYAQHHFWLRSYDDGVLQEWADWDFTYTPEEGWQGEIRYMNPVPEPATIGLLGCGLVAVVLAARRRRT